MPIFDWKCEACGLQWEELVKVDQSPHKCPHETETVDHPQHGSYTIKKLPAKFGTHISWSQWRAIE